MVVSNGVFRLGVPEQAKRQRIANQIYAAMIFAPTSPLQPFGMPTPHFVAFAANPQILHPFTEGWRQC
jgi:hypothetical protein